MFYPGQSAVSRSNAMRSVFVSILLSFLTLIAATSAASAAERAYAGLVVDAKTGQVLYAHAADAERYPASVTKVMTLYVLFQELEAGNLKLSTKMKVSKHAAAAVPTKLGLRAGSSISVEDAIGALVTLSANDISRVIAEHISGTESAFAKRMTQTARALGMSKTTYRNASGLPDSGQVTTASDQARLGIAVYQHFPKYYAYFQMRSFKYAGRTFGNHNRLLGSVAGVDGIKTGYINASGYNLLTAARKDNRHIVVVGFGFNTGASRNAKVAELVKEYLPKARSGSYLDVAMIPTPGSGIRYAAPVIPDPFPAFRMAALQARIELANAPVPDTRPVELIAGTGVEAANLVAANAAPTPQPAPQIDVIGAWISQTLKLDENTAAPLPPAAIGTASGKSIDLLTSGSVQKVAERTDQGEIGWIVQVGAAPSEQGAQSLLASAARVGAIGDMRRYVERFEKNGQVYFRARIAGFAGRDQARVTCEELKQQNMSCLAMQG